jgi:hypothetical protein
MKRNILLTFSDDDEYADVLVAIRNLRSGEPTNSPVERGYAIAAICRQWGHRARADKLNGAGIPPLPAEKP